jgi:hypothetical protein
MRRETRKGWQPEQQQLQPHHHRLQHAQEAPPTLASQLLMHTSNMHTQQQQQAVRCSRRVMEPFLLLRLLPAQVPCQQLLGT